MALLESPPCSVSDQEAKALFEEARQRRRRRWTIGVLCVVTIAVVLSILASSNPATPPPHAHQTSGLPRWAPPGSARATPAVFVAGDGKGGIGVYSTASGSLMRTLSLETPGGPDQQAALSRDRQTVYFVQPAGPCSGDILSAPVSGSGPNAIVILVPQIMALDPSPSPTSSDLAWVGVTCGPTGSVATSALYVTDLTTGAQRDLGAFSGQHADNAISWSPDGKRLAVESGTTVALLNANQPSSKAVRLLSVKPACFLESPVFLSQHNQLAVIRSCYRTNGTYGPSRALVYNVATGRPEAVIASAPQGSTFQGLSVDATGSHVLLGVVSKYPEGAENAQVENGRLVEITKTSPTDAEW
jgi:hypothetical protein